MKDIEIIVSVFKNGYAIGPTLRNRQYYHSEDTAVRDAEHFIRDGFSVVVRPHYKDERADGLSYYEWRSFNGSALEKVWFSV